MRGKFRPKLSWAVLAAGVMLPRLLPAADSLAVLLWGPEPAQRSICELRFALSKPVPASASFRVQFPAGIDLSEVLLVGSDRIDGGLSFRRAEQEIVITRSGRGHEIPPGTLVDLKIANVRSIGAPTGPAKVRLVLQEAGEMLASIEAAPQMQARSPRSER
jgi:hypothetical protein